MREAWLVLVLGLFIAGCGFGGDSDGQQIDESLKNDLVSEEYGIVTDSFIVIKDHIRKNENLASILLPYNVPYATIDQLVKAAKGVFDVRKIAAGKPYSVFCRKDASGVASCFIYEANAMEYIVFDMRDSLHIYKGQKPVDKKTMYVKGAVNASLYADLQKHHADPTLAIELSEIYAWTIDFYRIQKGDEFEVLYTENFVEGKSVGIDRILASTFTHSGKAIKAYHFESDKEKGYFDDQGNNLKRAFLKAPVKFSRISSGYSNRRFHPVQKRFKAHLGTDYAAPSGTPIMTVGDGVITEARYKANNGNYVKVKHNGTYSTQYLHMSKIKSGIKPGVRVSQGDIIGYVGSTGLATGPHVCYRFWKNGKQVNHRTEELPESEPVSSSNRATFDVQVAKLDSLLNTKRTSL